MLARPPATNNRMYNPSLQLQPKIMRACWGGIHENRNFLIKGVDQEEAEEAEAEAEGEGEGE